MNRLGAWDYLKWRHIIPITREGHVIAAKIIVYADDDEEYFSFTSREAYDSLKEWMEYRAQCGEDITGESWLMSNLWDVITPRGKGVVTIPKRLQHTGLKRLIEMALWAQGIRHKEERINRRRAIPKIILMVMGKTHLIYLAEFLLCAKGVECTSKKIEVISFFIVLASVKSPSSNRPDSLQDVFQHWHLIPEIMVLRWQVSYLDLVNLIQTP